MSSLYSCKSHAPAWFITKFDLDLNVLATYHVDHHSCDCPRGAHPTCRHRKMLKVFISGGHVDDGWFLDYETRMWTAPLRSLLSEEQEKHVLEPMVDALKAAANGSGATAVEVPGEVSGIASPGTTRVTHIRRLT